MFARLRGLVFVIESVCICVCVSVKYEGLSVYRWQSLCDLSTRCDFVSRIVCWVVHSLLVPKHSVFPCTPAQALADHFVSACVDDCGCGAVES